MPALVASAIHLNIAFVSAPLLARVGLCVQRRHISAGPHEPVEFEAYLAGGVNDATLHRAVIQAHRHWLDQWPLLHPLMRRRDQLAGQCPRSFARASHLVAYRGGQSIGAKLRRITLFMIFGGGFAHPHLHSRTEGIHRASGPSLL